MLDLSFWDIYCPALAALISSLIFYHGTIFCINYAMVRRHMKKYEDFQEKVAKGEITPEMLGITAPGARGFPSAPNTTASGSEPPAAGQYL